MDNNKRILLIGNPASIHVYNYVKNVLCFEGFDVTIFNYNGENVGVREELFAFYSSQNVKLVEGLKPREYLELGYLKYIKKTVQLLNSLGSFDICHEHYIKHYISPAIYKARHLYGRIVLTYYGSDLYRIDKIRRFLTIPSLKVADRITFISDDMIDYYKKLPFYMRKFLNKSVVVDFGNMFYDRIASLTDDKESCKIRLGFDPKRVLITIGYVGRPQMQQYETLKALLSDNRILGSHVQYAIPVYGIKDDDYEKLKLLADNDKCQIKLFRNFMDEEEVSTLRAGTDIFIHAQTTDALSCAMLEHLYAGSVVVNGSWLRYGTLENNSVYYKTFDSFSSLSNQVYSVIENIKKEEQLSSNNRVIVSQMTSWDVLRPIWLNLYT